MRVVEEWYVSLHYATYAVQFTDGICTATPPIAHWMQGKSWEYVYKWVEKKGGTFERLKLDRRPI